MSSLPWVINPPLILVSALFFFAVVAAFYLAGWALAVGILRLAAGRLPLGAEKRLLLTALILPPLLAGSLTFGGATLRHSHATEATEHHSMACQQMFSQPFWAGVPGAANLVAGALVNGLAWLLGAVGLALLLRLLWATVQLERGLAPLLSPPSPRLQSALVRVACDLPGLPADRFFECPLPAAFSSVLGLWQVRCVLSAAFIAGAPDDELDAVVAHEAGHLQAGDVRASFLVGALNCLFFPLRPVRLLGRLWRERAELACDAAAVAATGKPLAMAAAILRVSGVPIKGAALPAIALPFADQAACAPELRIKRLLSLAEQAALPPAPETRAQVALGWLTTVLLAAAGLGVLLSAGMVCYAHCFLEAVSHLLP